MYDPPIWVFKTEEAYAVYGKTFSIKDELKKVQGARWVDPPKAWYLPKTVQALEKLRELKIPFKVKVKRAAYCHTPEEIIFAFEDEVKQGFIRRNFCTRCDSHYGQVNIEAIDV